MSAIPKTPKTPSLVDKAKNEAAAQSNKEINAIYNSLTWQWDLRLPSTTFESPSDRRSKSKSEESDLACEIVGRIRYLYYKAHVNLFAALDKFDQEATHMYVRWVQKPNADREVIPETTEKRPHPVTPSERIELLKRLQIILCELFNNTQSLQRSVPSKANSPVLSAQKTQIDDSPVAFPLSSAQKHDGKRRFEPFTDINIGAKKAKGPEARASGRENFYRFPPPQWNVSRPQKTTTKTDQVNLMPLKGDMNVNMNTSFETNVPDVFSQSFSSTLLNTQSTDPESEPKSEPEPEPKPELTIKLCSDHLSLDDDVPKTQSSDFGSIFDPVEAERVWTESFGANIPSPGVPKYDVVNDTTEGMSRKVVDEVLDKTVDDPNPKKLERCLNEMLPILPSCLKRAPFFVSYEITRVFLSLQVPISDFTLPYVKEWIEYDKLWKMLKTLPILQDKKFPEKCGAKVWEIAANGYSHGFNGVVFAASLRENKTQSEPLFSFQLQPMKLDLTNRLERIFGSDRFFEFEIPDLERKRYGPKVAKVDDNTWGVLKSWLVNGDHQLLGRTYKSFFVKIKDRKRKSSLKSDAEEESSVTPFRAFLFATDGYGFVNGSPHARMTVEELLDFIRPTSENKNQPYMKLFARTALVLSRNQATVTVERTQIRYKNDIRNPDLHNPKKTYVMTDGAGKMSLSLAKKIVFKLNLFHIPSAFQGRFGEAKGLWIVDRSDDIENDWIELYSEQCKWNRGEEGGDEFDHRSRRTFEVVGHSTPLKTADLNTQLLPLLMHQATNRRRMRGAIIKALKEGLSHSLEELKTALTGPRELRSWVRPTNSSIRDRIKTGAIQWRGGLPAKHEDRLSILLDAGFDPRSSFFLMELAKKSLTTRCNDLKARLNITVGKSTIAYMVPDFWNILEPNEVHLSFSSFIDNETGLSDTQLEDVDVLVARNPAHYPSDIQRVTAVSKHELRHLKDVIVFSTRGYPSLADKLSGGDYDGDKAWICWDPAIVESFANADIPQVPDLIKDGFIKQDKTTYAQLTKGHSDPTNAFLSASFDFNMHQSMLGYATIFKEKIAYMVDDLNRKEVIFLSTLLSNLVDQPKQGFVFMERDLDKVKAHITATTGKPFMPQYKIKDGLPNSEKHILDQMVILAHKQTDKLLTDLTNSIKSPPDYDPILAQLYRDQRDKGKVSTDGSASPEEVERGAQWKVLLDHLDADIEKIKNKWVSFYCRSHNSAPSRRFSDLDETRADFPLIRDACFAAFLAIKPHASSKLIHTWLDQDTEAEFGQWAILRASALYASYAPLRSYRYPVKVSNLVWWMAGKQYAFIKANQHGMTPVSDSMYVMLKANAGFVRQARAHEGEGTLIVDEMGDTDESDLFDDDD